MTSVLGPGLVALLITAMAFAANPAKAEITVPKGHYVPFFRDLGEPDQEVGPLIVDKYPVTNQEFLAFLRKNPQWQKNNVKKIFAGRGYLEHWKGNLKFPISIRFQPVTNVSWFVAKKYCEAHNKRLMTIAEWEYVSDSQNPENLNLILNWYGQTGDNLRAVSLSKSNPFGVAGMHGLIWEWVDDFSSAIVAGDSRSSSEMSKTMFCGSGSLKAKDPSQYATFMRFAHRSSLKANSVGRNLGFRCVKQIDN